MFYFEVTIISKGRDGFIGVGFCRQCVPMTRLPGWEDDSWGYHGDDGHSFCCQGTGQEYGPKFSTGDVIGCAINFVSGECFYTKNGVHLGIAFTGLTGELYPSIGLRTIGEQVRVNFGAQPFVFDIDYYYRQEKRRLYKSVREEEDDVSSQVQNLVGAYLSHNGYVDSARAMAVDISNQSDKTISPPPIDLEASHRQRIRAAVITGEMDLALAMLETCFPEVLRQHEKLLFQIRCRKFIELMRKCAMQSDDHTQQPDLIKVSPRKDEFHVTTERIVVDSTMEEVTSEKNMESMDDVPDLPSNVTSLLTEAIQYGQELQALYSNPSDASFRTGMEEAFSLLAYSDPLASPVAHLLSPALRTEIAEDINSAILVTSGKSARSELEEIVASVGNKIGLLKGTQFVNVQRDFFGDV